MINEEFGLDAEQTAMLCSALLALRKHDPKFYSLYHWMPKWNRRILSTNPFWHVPPFSVEELRKYRRIAIANPGIAHPEDDRKYLPLNCLLKPVNAQKQLRLFDQDSRGDGS